MEIQQKLKFISSGRQVLIKTANYYLTSKGFYPSSLKLEQKLNYDDMVFELHQVQITDSIITRQFDDIICFQKELAIQHKKSGKFISATLDQDMWKFQLNNSIDPSCLFILKPLYKGQKTNVNYVEFDNDMYLTLSKQSLEQYGQSFQEYNVTQDKSKQEQALTAIQTDQNTVPISTFQFLEVEQQSKQLSYGSIVKIKLIEKNAYLLQTNLIENQSYFTEKYEPIWKNFNEKKEIFHYDLWKIFHPGKLGQNLQDKDFFYLKNISGNYYLNETSICQDFNQASQFQIQDFKVNGNQYSGRICLNSLTITAKSIDEKQTEQFSYIDYKENPSKKDLIQFEQCEKIDLITNNWLNNISDILVETNSILKANTSQLKIFLSQNNIFDQLPILTDKLYLIEQSLIDLIKFCFVNGDQIEFLDQKYLFYYEPNSANQNIIRSTNLIQVFFSFLEQTVVSFDIAVELIPPPQEIQQQVDDGIAILTEIRQILKQVFIFFQSLCNCNQQNGLLLINGYKEQLIRYLGMRVGAFSSLIRILQTNQNLMTVDVDNTIGLNQEKLNLKSQSLIDQVLIRMKSIGQHAWPNLFKFLCLFCKSNNQIQHQNIKIICDTLCIKNGFLFEIYPKEDMLLYINIDDRFFEISSIYGNNFEFQEIKELFEEQMILISNLSNGKFFEQRHYFQQQLPTSHLMSYICQKKINQSLMSKIMQIFINLYIQWHPFYVKQMPKLVFSDQKLYQLKQKEITQKTQQFSENEIKLIEKLYAIICEQLKIQLVSHEGRLNLTQGMSQYLRLYQRICSLKITNHNQLKAISSELADDHSFLIQAFQSLNESLEQDSPPIQLIQLFEQFQESKKIFNDIANTFINYFTFIIDLSYNKQFIESVKASQNKAQILFDISLIQNYQKIGYFTLNIINHKQLDSKIRIQSLILIEKVFQPKKNLISILKNSIFLENEWEYQIYQSIKKAKKIFLKILNIKKDSYLIKQGIDALQELQSKMKQSYEYLLVIGKIIQIMKLDQILIDLLSQFQYDCLMSTKKLNEQLNLNNEEEVLLQICNDIFVILMMVCQINVQFKYKILKQYQLVQSYLSCLNIGQYDLIKVIYSDQYDLINSASESFINGLFKNPTIESFQILESLIEQHNVFFEKNLIIIMINIQNLLKHKTLNFQDLIDMQGQTQTQWRSDVRLGKYPIGYQLAFLNLIIKILKHATQQQRLTIKIHFSLQSIFQSLLTLQDVYIIQEQEQFIYQSQTYNIQQDINHEELLFNTIIKFHFLELLNLLIDIDDMKQFFGDQNEILNRFIFNQLKLLKNNIISLDYNEFHGYQKQNQFYEFLETKFFNNKQSLPINQFKNQQSKEFARILSQQFASCFQFTSYIKLILKISIKLGVCLQLLRNEFGDNQSRQKSIRSHTSINYKSKSYSNDQIEFGQQKEQTILNIDLKNDIEQLILECESFLIKNLGQQEIQDHIEDFHKISLQFNKLFSRQLNIKGIHSIHPSQEIQNNIFLQPTCIYDSRIYQLTQIANYNKSELRMKQLHTLTQSNDDICLELYTMYFQIFTKMNMIDANFEFQIKNSTEFISTLVICLKTCLKNIQTYFKIIIKVLKFLQKILDISPYMKLTFNEACKQFKKHQEGKVTESQQIILKIATKQLQNQIIDQGFFQIFLQFCEQYNGLKISQNYQSYIQDDTIKNKIFYQFLITACKLIRGTDSANLHAQKTLFQLLGQNINNSLLLILQQNFNTQFEMNEIQKIHFNVKSEIKRVPLTIDQLDKDHFLNQNQNQVRNHWGKNMIVTQIEFIQLLAEDHFRPFQDFFREQQDFPKSINILNTLQQILLNIFSQESFQTFNHDDYRIIVSCFDCIKELIQGPCPQNQKFIRQPTFLRLCYKILNYDDSQKMFLQVYQNFTKHSIIDNRSRRATQNEFINQHVTQTKNQIQQTFVQFYQFYPIYCQKLLKSFQTANTQNFRLYMLSEIKFRCSQTLESLTDDENMLTETLKNITQIINEKVLIKNITNQYVKFKILHSSGKNYTNGIFSHLLEGKQKLLQSNYLPQDNQNEKWSLQEKVTVSLAVKDFCDSFIIETGFSLFNILAQVYQNNNKDTLQRIYEQIDQKQKSKKKLQSILLYNFYQSFYSLQLITERLTGNFMSEKQQASMNDKIFTPYKQNKTEDDSNLQEKKLGYRALRFFATRSGSIEVVLPTKAIKQVIFPLVPHCFALNKQIKDKFLTDLDLSSQQAKLESMLYNSNKVIQKLQTEYKFQAIYKRYLIVNLIASNQEAWKQVIFYVIVCQNLMIILTSNGGYDQILDSLLLSLNILQIVLQFVVFFIFLIRKLPYLRIKSKEIVYERNINRIRKREIKYKYLDQSSSVVQQEDFILERTDKFLLEQNPFLRFYYNLLDSLVLCKYVFLDYEMIYFLIFTTLAVVGLQYKPVLALLLLDVFWRFPMLAAIIHSVWRPITSIILLLASFFLLQYNYSLLIYNFYSEDSNYSQYCNNFLQCFSFILDVTFKKDSGAPGVYENPDFRYGLLNFWEFCYYFFAISLVYSIFTGLILDSFGTDREEAQEFQTAVEEYCLICGIDKGIIEKKAIHKKGFRFHSKYEHSVWNYLFFISYLQGKKKSEYNGIESYVSEQIKKESIQWLPANLSLSIPEQDQDLIDEQISHSIEERSKKGKK